MSILAKKLMFVMSQRRREAIPPTLMEILGQRTVGPDMGQYDPVTDTGYYGLVPSTELIAGDVLATQIGLTAGVPQYNDSGWFKFYVGPEASCNRNNNGYAYVAYVAKMPNRHSVTWNIINAVNAVYGYRQEPLMGMNSQVRLITGANQDPSDVYTDSLCESNNGGHSEWNNLVYRIHTLESNCLNPSETSSSVNTNGGPQIGNNWAEYDDSDLNFGYIVSQTYCQEKSARSTHACVRGVWGISSIYSASLSISHASHVWRPVLQPTSPTVLLLHGDGADGSTNITDSSVYSHPVTVNGNARISTDQSVYPGGSSMYFDGANSYLEIDPFPFIFETNDFTVEFWFKTSSSSTRQFLFQLGSSSTQSSQTHLAIEIYDGQIRLQMGDCSNYYIQSGYNVISNMWKHLSVVRKTGLVTLFIDGVSIFTYNANVGLCPPTLFSIGIGHGYAFKGYIQDLRITKNKALYTTNFTPPTALLPDPDPYDFSLFS